MKIKKGDNVIVIAGKDKGKSAKVLKAIPKKEQVIVEGLNMRKKHQKSRQKDKKGQVIEFAMPIHVSNVMLSVDGKRVRKAKTGAAAPKKAVEKKAPAVKKEKKN